MILSDVIVHGLTACIAFILQIVIFKVTTKRPLRYWILILAGLAIFTSSYFGISFPKSGFIGLVLLLANKSFKNLRHTILETFFIPFTFALMVETGHFPDYSNLFPFCPRLLFCWSIYTFACLFAMVCSKCPSSSGLLSNDAN